MDFFKKKPKAKETSIEMINRSNDRVLQFQINQLQQPISSIANSTNPDTNLRIKLVGFKLTDKTLVTRIKFEHVGKIS
jgi:hypothetical protein